MSYFPFYIDIAGKSGLIVGGGRVAARKASKLLPFGPKLTVVSLRFCEELENMAGIERITGSFDESLLKGKCFVIAATNDNRLNEQISKLCRERSILINAVDDQENCSFIFPSLIKKGKLTVGISTGGASPSAAIFLKEQFEGLIPENMEQILDFLANTRERIRSCTESEAQRARLYRILLARCIADRSIMEDWRRFEQFLCEETSHGESAL